MSEVIVNYRIAGTRSSVFDVYHYLKSGHWSHAQIADILRISPEQLAAALRYIEQNTAEVAEIDRQIDERNARGTPPEVEAKLAETRARMQAWLEERRAARRQEANGEGHPGGR